MSSSKVFVLVHSPLVSPFTWLPVATQLEAQHYGVIVPTLTDYSDLATPYWQQHVQSVAEAFQAISGSELILVGHSGAGPLLPNITQALSIPVASYIFVDATLPHPGLSRLAQLERYNPEAGKALRTDLDKGSLYPNWTNEVLAEVIADADLREQLLTELHPRKQAFFEEPFPHNPHWPEAPCSYLQLSAAYDGACQEAGRLGWTVQKINQANHFYMLTNPSEVSHALIKLSQPKFG